MSTCDSRNVSIDCISDDIIKLTNRYDFSQSEFVMRSLRYHYMKFDEE